MRQILSLIITVTLLLSLSGCEMPQPAAQIVATTLPVYEFATRLCNGTGLQVSRLVTENISCLHDYTLQTRQMRMIENAEVIVMSGSGLEGFLAGALPENANIIDASVGIALTCNEHAHGHEHNHQHDQDPHIWLSPENAKQMAETICHAFVTAYPAYADLIKENMTTLARELDTLETYAQEQLSNLHCRDLITFHDGFSYMANAFDLRILHAIEEESGSEASASELIELIRIVAEHNLNAVFTERNGSNAAAEIIAAETGAKIYQLDMAISGDSYFDAMYHNIDTLKEALE